MRRTCAPTRMPTRSTGKEPRAIDRQSLGLGVTHTAQEGDALGCGGPLGRLGVGPPGAGSWGTLHDPGDAR